MVEKERKISQMSDESLCENYAGNKLIKFPFLILMTDDLKRKKNKIKERQEKGRKSVCIERKREEICSQRKAQLLCSACSFIPSATNSL